MKQAIPGSCTGFMGSLDVLRLPSHEIRPCGSPSDPHQPYGGRFRIEKSRCFGEAAFG